MLKTACLFEKAFESYEESESSFRTDWSHDIPDYLDWEHVSQLMKMLEIFYEIIVMISSSKYVTTNSFILEISNLSVLLTDMQSDSDLSVRHIGLHMKLKFDKYWGDP